MRRLAWAGSLPALALVTAGGAQPLDALRLADLPDAQVYVAGEVHDNQVHHEGQGLVIDAVQPTAVVLEMLTPERAGGWDPGLKDDPEALDAALGWTAAGWPDASLYAPLFAAIPDGAAVLGAAPDPDLVREAMTRGAAAVFAGLSDGDAALYGLGEPLPLEEQAAREAMQQASHCDGLPDDLLPGFVEAQRLRDAAFARSVLGALETYGPPVVLITGNGHARTDWGVPAALKRAAPEVEVVSIGQFEGAGGPPVDVTVTTPAPGGGRPDPCERFRSRAGGD